MNHLEPCQTLVTKNSSFCTPLAEGTYWLGRILTWPLHHGVERIERLTERSLNEDWHGRLQSLRLEILRRIWWAISGVLLAIVGFVPAIAGGILMFLANLDKEDMTLIEPEPSCKPPILPLDQDPKVTTFNLGALPDWITVRNQLRPLEERIDQFIDYVLHHQDADCICLQELFDQDAIRVVKRCREKYPWMVVDAGPRTFGMNSGLAVLSKFPIKKDREKQQEPRFWKFKEALDEDKWANKGVLGVQIQVHPERDVVILNTHFQSGYAKRYQDIRAHSIEGIKAIYEMYNKIYAGVKNDITMFTVGDFNMHKYEDERKVVVEGKIQDVTWENWNEGKLKHNSEWPERAEFFYDINKHHALDDGSCWLKKSPWTLWDFQHKDEWILQHNQADHILIHRGHRIPKGKVRADLEMGRCSDHVAVCWEPDDSEKNVLGRVPEDAMA